MALNKIQKIHMKEELESIKTTYRKMKLIKPEEFARLWKPDIFPYSNKNRLYREVTDKILQNFYDFHYAFEKLPDSYKDDILSSGQFGGFMGKITTHMEYKNWKKGKHSPIKVISYNLYLKFFTIGIQGLISTMPNEFRSYLENELNPILSLMNSIVKVLKIDIPKLKLLDRKQLKKPPQ